MTYKETLYIQEHRCGYYSINITIVNSASDHHVAGCIMLGVFLLDEDDQHLLEEIGRDISGTGYFDPIADPPTEEIPVLPSTKRVRARTILPITTSRHFIFSFVPWPLEHMFAAVLNHIRQCAAIPRYLILPQLAYYRHLQDKYTPIPFDGIFSFYIACMKRPCPIFVYRDVEFHMELPVDTFLCIN
jgi:hypothetical protein